MAETIRLGSEDDGEDDGYVVVTLKTASSPETSEVRLDVLEWQSRFAEFYAANAKKPAHEYNALLCDLIEKEAGLARPSHAVAQQLQNRIAVLAKELFKKKGMIVE